MNGSETKSTLSNRLNDAMTELMLLETRLPRDDYNVVGPCERAMANVREALRLIGE